MPLEFPSLDAELKRGAKLEIRKHLRRILPTFFPTIKTEIGNVVRGLLKSSPEYQSVANNGTLKGELGITDASLFDDIIDIWAQNIEIRYKSNRGLGRIEISLIRSDYSDVLSSESARFFYSSKSGSGVLEWLRWLLLEGGSPIVLGFEFSTARPGRTGLGIMIPSRSDWSVPPEFAGTADDNFATRALSEIDKRITRILKRQLSNI